MEKYVKEKTESIEKLHVERRSALAWKTMHEVTKMKSTPLSKIKGSSKAERIDQTLAAPFSTIRFLIPFQLTPANSC